MATNAHIITSSKLRELLATLTGPQEKIDEVVELTLVKLAEDIAIEASNAAALLASHRRVRALEARDLNYIGKHHYGIPTGELEGRNGCGEDSDHPAADSPSSAADSPPRRGRRAINRRGK